MSAVPTPPSTTAAGLADRFGPAQLAGVEEGIGELTCRAMALLPAKRRTGLRTGTATIDLDGTDVECYGSHKDGIAYNYKGQRAGRPHVAAWAEAGLAVAADLLAGDEDPRPGAGGLIERSVATIRAAGVSARPRVRGDVGYFAKEIAWAAVTNECDFSLGVTRNKAAWRAAASVTISGNVYRDGNNNGIRDPGEPGVPGIRVRHGSGMAATVTATDGGYTLGGLPQAGNLLVESGWMRSQCPPPATPTSLDCAAGPGPDNDFAVANQFLHYPLAGAHSATGVDVGLLPDWPGDSLLPARTATGAVAANSVDVAARLSWVSDTCAGGAYHICRPADTFLMTGQIYNQGTVALTGIRAVIAVPAGDCLTGVGLVATATAPVSPRPPRPRMPPLPTAAPAP